MVRVRGSASKYVTSENLDAAPDGELEGGSELAVVPDGAHSYRSSEQLDLMPPGAIRGTPDEEQLRPTALDRVRSALSPRSRARAYSPVPRIQGAPSALP